MPKVANKLLGEGIRCHHNGIATLAHGHCGKAIGVNIYVSSAVGRLYAHAIGYRYTIGTAYSYGIAMLQGVSCHSLVGTAS